MFSDDLKHYKSKLFQWKDVNPETIKERVQFVKKFCIKKGDIAINCLNMTAFESVLSLEYI